MKTEKNILIAFILNLGFAIFEILGGLFTNSIAILSDSIHDFCDALSIGFSYYLEKKSKKKPDNNYTFGYRRYSILGAFITSSILTLGSILMIIEAIKRIITPSKINDSGMIIIALFGVIINVLAAYFTKGGHSLNQKSVNIHMLEDVFGWIIVLIGSILIKFTNINTIDSIISIIVSIFILLHTYKNLKEIVNLFLAKVPINININKLKKDLESIDNVLDIHHIHIWSLDENNIFITMHVKIKKDSIKIKEEIRNKLKEYNIEHSTIEIEGINEECKLKECIIKDEEHHH